MVVDAEVVTIEELSFNFQKFRCGFAKSLPTSVLAISGDFWWCLTVKHGHVLQDSYAGTKVLYPDYGCLGHVCMSDAYRWN